jgi:hypothetical protein
MKVESPHRGAPMIHFRSLLVLPLLVAGCSFDIAGPHPVADALIEGLTVELEISPSEVRPFEPFTVRLDVANRTADTIRVVTAHGCLATPHVLRDGVRIPMEGSWWGCTAAITTHVFAPGQTWSQTWRMRAAVYAEASGEVDGAPARRGHYRVRTVFDLLELAPDRQPFVEGEIRVR